MVIRSQDRKGVVIMDKNCMVRVKEYSQDLYTNKQYAIKFYANGFTTTLGQYYSEESAMAVVDKLYFALTHGDLIFDMPTKQEASYDELGVR